MKTKNNSVQINDMHSITLMILYSLAVFCHEQNIDLTITDGLSTHEQDIKLGRKSSTHREGRAFDFRAHNMSQKDQDKIWNFLYSNFNHYGAVVKDDVTGRLENKILVYHGEKENYHGHVQISRKYFLEDVF